MEVHLIHEPADSMLGGDSLRIGDHECEMRTYCIAVKQNVYRQFRVLPPPYMYLSNDDQH